MSGEEPRPEPTDGESGSAPEGAPRTVIVRRLFEEHNRKLIRFLLARLQNEQDAVEIAQEAYVQLLQLETPGSVGFLQAYLFRIARNLAVDRVRRRQVRAGHASTVAAEELFEIDLEERYLAGEQLLVFRQAVEELPEKCRVAFVMSKFDELTTEEIAERLAISARMVRKHLVHAMVYCRLRIDGLEPDAARRRTWS